ncbi:variant erythrocyte surface antigen-1 family protein [Babesia divergens]|uniref:Variant erythrocyte surface antigen-1 family protein n=1 Tax=Babesia divergens TaxID=32595 RepID=A0AAD9LHT4_BABDI|nr:variant erythrocyte surface antigen-1 family protein [Babesia divergens]
MVVHRTLLDSPKDMKESIDWILRVSGKDIDGDDNSGKLLAPLKVLLGQSVANDLDSNIMKLASTFRNFADWIGSGDYSYSYSSNARWENLCKWYSSARCCKDKSGCDKCKGGSCDGSCCNDCELIKCAKIFLGIIPCLFNGLNYLCIMCKGEWKEKHFGDSDFNGFLRVMGYPFTYVYPSGTGMSRSTTKPTTIRDMLQWFSVFPLRPAFEPLLEYCDSQCKDMPITIKAKELKLNLRSFCFLCPTILMTIECPDGSDSPFWYDLHRDALQFNCPVDVYTLFETVNEYIYTLSVHLNFLRIQCSRTKDQGGWQYCKYGRYTSAEGAVGSNTQSYYHYNQHCDCPKASEYLCTHTGNNYYYYGYNSGNDCPSPLRKFLMGNSSHFKNTVKMGFKLSEKSHDKEGEDICKVLKRLWEPGQESLITKLCRCLVFISRRPPESLGDLFAFFYNLPAKWNANYYSKSIKTFIENYIDDEPGSYEGKKIIDAVEKLRDSNGSHNNGWNYSQGDLQSLHGCNNNNYYHSCGHYLRPLILEVYDLYDQMYVSMYVSWIVYLAPKFYSLLEDLKGKFEQCNFCRGHGGNGWDYITNCPCALPTLYSYGFTFNDPSQFHSKRCTDIIEQLKTVLGDSAPLKELIQECDEFLWSIRQMFLFPLCIAWARVILQLIYMFIFQLDITRFGSHLFSKSSKESPAILFTTKRVKVSKVSYFHY